MVLHPAKFSLHPAEQNHQIIAITQVSRGTNPRCSLDGTALWWYNIGINPGVCWYMANTFSRGMYQLHPDAKRRDVIYMPRLNVLAIYQQTPGFIAIISPKQQRLSSFHRELFFCTRWMWLYRRGYSDHYRTTLTDYRDAEFYGHLLKFEEWPTLNHAVNEPWWCDQEAILTDCSILYSTLADGNIFVSLRAEFKFWAFFLHYRKRRSWTASDAENFLRSYCLFSVHLRPFSSNYGYKVSYHC